MIERRSNKDIEILFLKLEAAGYKVNPLVRAYQNADEYPYLCYSVHWEFDFGKEFNEVKHFNETQFDYESIKHIPKISYVNLVNKLDEMIKESTNT